MAQVVLDERLGDLFAADRTMGGDTDLGEVGLSVPQELTWEPLPVADLDVVGVEPDGS
jgi:hypothetical protein